MPLTNFEKQLRATIAEVESQGLSKADEPVIVGIRKPQGNKGPRFLLAGMGAKQHIRMNANSYLGLAFKERVIKAAEKGSRQFGTGPSAVRFISGTYAPHVKLEKRLAQFHGRDACMLNSSAYTTVLGVLATLTSPETIIISDELNHNCIINGMRLARPKDRKVYKHLDLAQLESQIKECIGLCENVIIITDGIFSMRGDHAPLDKICELTRKYSRQFPRDIVLIVDDSHGVGVFGKTGRGTEEYTNAKGVDVLIGTLGKGFGVNGGYVVTSKTIITFLREKNPLYIFTNPINSPDAAAAHEAVSLVDSAEGRKLIAWLHARTRQFRDGLMSHGYETLPGEHAIVPLIVRDTARTNKMVAFLRENGILATGLAFPIVPKGEETIRFQVCACHTEYDIDYVLDVLSRFN